MGRKGGSLQSKAAHFVSDLTTVFLNPISDKPPPSKHHTNSHSPPLDEDIESERIQEDSVSEEKSADLDCGPDTSSFTAFLYSLLSPSGSENDLSFDEENEDQSPVGESVSDTLSTESQSSTGKKGMFSRGKQSIGKAIYQAARFGGYYRQSSGRTTNSHMNIEDGNCSKLDGVQMMPIQTESKYGQQCDDLPDMSEPSLLLSKKLRSDLYFSLPALVQGRKWVLLYSTWRHGISLSSLYRRSMLWPGLSLLVVADRKGAVFGGLVEAPLVSSSKRKYQGTNNTFVFKNTASGLVIFRPTGVNRYYTLCSTEFIALGGGGHFALYLDGDLLTGSSSVSDTYGNSCLANSEDFEVKEVELWGFVYGSKYEEIVELSRTEAPGICRW